MIIKKMTTAQRLVDEIMDDFDYEKVQKIMQYLDWKWYPLDEVPTIDDLRKKSRHYLYEVIEWTLKFRGDYCISDGGIEVRAEFDNDIQRIGEVRLRFVLEDSSYID